GVANPYATAEKLLRAAKAAHPDIAHAFCSDAGVRLMRRDSEIAAEVMREIMRATGIVPLPVHDSFIVPTPHEERLKEAMENANPGGTVRAKFPCHTSPNLETAIFVPDQGAIQNRCDNMESESPVEGAVLVLGFAWRSGCRYDGATGPGEGSPPQYPRD